MIIAIDPGNIKSAYCVLREDYSIVEFGKVTNEELLEHIRTRGFKYNPLVIEMIASYGMAVGKEVFETCVWIGRFIECYGGRYELVYRKDEKMNLCGSMRAKDSNIRMALIDRFAKFDFKNGKGTKKNQDTFYGFAADMWSAMAVGVTYLDGVER